MDEHHLSLELILIVALGVGSQWLAWRARIPAIVLFLLAGLVVGPILGLVDPSADFGGLFGPIVGLAVAVILFEGGMNLHWHEFREAASGVKRLVTLGAVFSLVFSALAGHYVGGLEWPVALVFGAILVVTGPTVIMPMLRQSNLNRRTASYLKWEGIINDPTGALAAVLAFQYFLLAGTETAPEQVFVQLGWAILAALVLGVGAALFLAHAFRESWIPEFLKAPVTLVTVLSVYGLANLVFSEAGLLAATAMGMTLGNAELPSKTELRRFKEYVSVIMVSSVFVLLTADLDTEVLTHLDWHAIALVAAIILVVRPATVLLATVGTDMNWRERVLVSWIGPRGIVAAAVGGVFGAPMVGAGYQDGELLQPLIFAIVFATVVLHGFSIGWLARRLRLATDPHGVLIVGASPWSTELARALTNELNLPVLLVDSSWHRLRAARLAGVRVMYGEVLSEEIEQSLELNEIACLLAATSNDAYNALVCNNFSSELEHDRVFQLPMYAADDSQDSKRVARPKRGRPAFHPNAQYEELWRRHFQSWQFYKTRLTEDYDYEAFRRDCPPEAIVVGVQYAEGIFIFQPAENAAKPTVGSTVIYYAPKKGGDRAAKNARRRERETDSGERDNA